MESLTWAYGLGSAVLSDFVDFCEQASTLALPKMLEPEAHFGFIYIDGSHLFDDIFLDPYYSIRLLMMGGIVALDDSTNPHVAKVLKFLRGGSGTGVEELDLTRFRERPNSLSWRLGRRLGKGAADCDPVRWRNTAGMARPPFTRSDTMLGHLYCRSFSMTAREERFWFVVGFGLLNMLPRRR